jgi:hypothetical protein
MGCDIHVYTEFKRDGVWHSADHWEKSKYSEEETIPMRFECFGSRNYALFSFLANVRQRTWGNEVPVLAEPRGIPQDVSKRVREDAGLGDLHSLSFFTLTELRAGWEIYHKATIQYDAVVDTNDEATRGWLALPEATRGSPPTGYCAGSSSATAVDAKWNEPLEMIIGDGIRQITRFLSRLSLDEGVKDDEVRIVFGFDN